MAMLEKQAKQKYQVSAQELRGRGTLSRIAIAFERWYVYAPNVLLLLEPLIQCDAYDVSMIKAYIKQFTQNGTAVVIVTSFAEHIEDVSDSMVNLGYISYPKRKGWMKYNRVRKYINNSRVIGTPPE